MKNRTLGNNVTSDIKGIGDNQVRTDFNGHVNLHPGACSPLVGHRSSNAHTISI